jgi:two-component system CheB/CheR fusion protein
MKQRSNPGLRHSANKSISSMPTKKQQIKIVGMGASAGSLDAFELFFKHMPIGTGLAFVLITHLDSNHISVMTEIISKFTDMRVLTVTNRINVQSNTIYVIPPNKNIILQDNTLHLIEQDEPHYKNKPIDVFFQSLAEQRGKEAVAIVLSGTGDDGTKGLKFIKKNQGLILVQDPKTTKFDGMPKKAIQSGLVDFILKIKDMPNKLRQPSANVATGILQQIYALLFQHAGHHFSGYKLTTIYRRIEKQMLIHGIKDIAEYLTLLKKDADCIKDLYKDLLIGVTGFFRNPEAFEKLKDLVLQALVSKDKDYAFRVWIPACSTGEEAYTIAIIIKECVDKCKFQGRVQIFATDVDKDALIKARLGVYSQSIEAAIEEKLLKKYFVVTHNGYKIRSDLRKMMVFGVQNVILDAPFTMLDLISCRNLLIYLNNESQQKVISIFHFSLKPKGILLLGTSEGIAGNSDLFQLADKRCKIFSRKNTKSTHHALVNYTFNKNYNVNIASTSNFLNNEKSILSKQLDKILQNNSVHAAMVIDHSGDILLMQGKMAHYLNTLEHHSFTPNLFDLIQPRLHDVFISAIKAASSTKSEIKNNIIFKKDNDKVLLDLKIISLKKLLPNKKTFILIFDKVIMPEQIEKNLKKYQSLVKMSKKIISLENDLQDSNEALQAALEEHQSNHEELQSTNEELQSTNEEIETSKEQLLSLNEELVIVNTELQTQIDKLVSINDDMSNLLHSTEMMALFLDKNLKIKRYTPRLLDLIALQPSDVGRYYYHFANNIKYPHIDQDIKKVLSSHVPKSLEVESKHGHWYQVVIMPYKTLSKVYDGVVITFNSITHYKKCMKELTDSNISLTEMNQNLENILEIVKQPIMMIDHQLKILKVNPAFLAYFPKIKKSPINSYFYDFFDAMNNTKFLTALKKVLKKGETLINFEIKATHPLPARKLSINANRVIHKDGNQMLLLTLSIINE